MTIIDWDAKQFTTVGSFASYLATLPIFPAMSKIVMHHTYVPTQATWRGMESIDALERYYRDQVVWYDSAGVKHVGGWSAGPNLFVCLGSPDAAWDGIFQGTPINHVGVHAGACNTAGPGIEVVGNFDLAPWPAPLNALLLDLVLVLLKWGRLLPSAVIGHRDCNSPKTCPGSKVDLVSFRTTLAARLVDPWAAWGEDFPLPFEQRQWDLAQAWIKRYSQLGRARSFPQYVEDGQGTVLQRFDKGIVIDRNGVRGKAWTFDELLV